MRKEKIRKHLIVFLINKTKKKAFNLIIEIKIKKTFFIKIHFYKKINTKK